MDIYYCMVHERKKFVAACPNLLTESQKWQKREETGDSAVKPSEEALEPTTEFNHNLDSGSESNLGQTDGRPSALTTLPSQFPWRQAFEAC